VKEASPIKQAVNKSQGAENLTEETEVEHGTDGDKDEKRYFPVKNDPHQGPEIRGEKEIGQPGLEGAGRAEHSAEPDLSVARRSPVKHRKSQNQGEEKEPLQPSRPPRERDLGEGNAVKHLLKESEGTNPAAHETPEKEPVKKKASQQVKSPLYGHFGKGPEGGHYMLKDAQGAGHEGRRTGITVKPGKT